MDTSWMTENLHKFVQLYLWGFCCCKTNPAVSAPDILVHKKEAGSSHHNPTTTSNSKENTFFGFLSLIQKSKAKEKKSSSLWR